MLWQQANQRSRVDPRDRSMRPRSGRRPRLMRCTFPWHPTRSGSGAAQAWAGPVKKKLAPNHKIPSPCFPCFRPPFPSFCSLFSSPQHSAARTALSILPEGARRLFLFSLPAVLPARFSSSPLCVSARSRCSHPTDCLRATARQTVDSHPTRAHEKHRARQRRPDASLQTLALP